MSGTISRKRSSNIDRAEMRSRRIMADKIKNANLTSTTLGRNLRGTNMSASSLNSVDTIGSKNTIDSYASNPSNDSRSCESPASNKRGRRPSLSNPLGRSEFNFETSSVLTDITEKEEFEPVGGNPLSSRTSGTNDNSLDLDEADSVVEETLRQLHVAKASENVGLNSSFNDMMRAKGSFEALSDDDSDFEDNEMDRNPPPLPAGKKVSGKGKKLSKDNGPVVSEMLGTKKRVTTKLKTTRSIGNRMPDLSNTSGTFGKLSYQNDLDPETLRSSLRKIEVGNSGSKLNSSQKKLKVKGHKSRRKTQRKRSRRGTGGSGCAIS